MSRHSPTPDLSNCTAGGFLLRHQRLQHRLPIGVRSLVWQAVLGALIAAGMLLTFHQVVHGAVQQSALRHKASAVHTEATWRCNALQGQAASDSCLLKLNAAATGEDLLQAQTTMLARHDAINTPSRNR
jgi:hypothetical protein